MLFEFRNFLYILLVYHESNLMVFGISMKHGIEMRDLYMKNKNFCLKNETL